MLSLKGSENFRARVALAALCGKEVLLDELHSESLESPGLRKSEACVLKLLESVTQGTEISVNSTHTAVTLRPGALHGQDFQFVFHCHNERGLTFYLEFLAMIAPWFKQPIDVILKGVTDHPLDMSIDAFRSLLKSVFTQLNLPEVETTVERRGLLPLGGGEVRFQCGTLKAVTPFQLVFPGRVARVRGNVFTCHLAPSFATSFDSARRVLNELLSDVWVHTDLRKGDKAGLSRGMGLTLIAETSKGVQYAASAVSTTNRDSIAADGSAANLNSQADQNTHATGSNATAVAMRRNQHMKIQAILAKEQAKKEREIGEDVKLTSQERIGEEVACKLLASIFAGGVVDLAFQWVPILYMSLSENHRPSRVLLGPLTPASVQLLRDIKTFLGVKFFLEASDEAIKSILASHADADGDKGEKGKEEDEDSKSDVGGKDTKSRPKMGVEVESDPETGSNENQSEELEPESEKQIQNVLKQDQREHCTLLTCVGASLSNISRTTF